MMISEINNGLSFANRKNSDFAIECCPRPRQINKVSYGSLLVENAIKDIALREASRIIAQDIYMKSHK